QRPGSRAGEKPQTGSPGRSPPGTGALGRSAAPTGSTRDSRVAAGGWMTTFLSIRIEGSLLGPDILDQLLAADLPGQKSADFGLEARRNLTDEIAAIFA